MEQIERKYFWLIIPYFLVIGTLYIWGYWSTFNINAFEYTSINEAITASFIPLASGIIFVIIGASIGTFASQKDTPKEETPKEETPKNNEKNMSRMDWIIFLGFFMPGVINFVITDDIGSRWTTSSILLSIIPTIALIKSNILSESISPQMRSSVLFIFCCTPFFSFALGKSNAYKILSNTEYFYMEIESTKFKYIGHLQDKTFFSDLKNNKVLIIQDGEIEKLSLQRNNGGY